MSSLQHAPLVYKINEYKINVETFSVQGTIRMY